MSGFDTTTAAATTAELVDMLRALSDHVDGSLADGVRSLAPMLLVKTRGWGGKPDELRLHLLLVPFNEDAEKRAVLRELGRRLYADQVVPAGAALCSEAWTAADLAPGEKPADSPDRREVVVVFAGSLDRGRAAMRAMFVSRDGADVIVPGRWEDPQTEGMAAPLLNHLWSGYFEAVLAKHALRN